MIGVVMLVALVACAVAVALWDRDSVVLDFPDSERRSCFVVGDTRVFFDGVEVDGVLSVQIALGVGTTVRDLTAAAEAFGAVIRQTGASAALAAAQMEAFGSRFREE